MKLWTSVALVGRPPGSRVRTSQVGAVKAPGFTRDDVNTGLSLTVGHGPAETSMADSAGVRQRDEEKAGIREPNQKYDRWEG